MSKLIDALSEMEFTAESDGLYKSHGTDGRSEISVYVDPQEGIIQVMKMPHDPEDRTIVVTWNQACPELLTLLESWAK